MTPIEELKIRARLLLNAIVRGDPAALDLARRASKARRWPLPDAWTLSLCLNIVSVEAGFDQWTHARRILGGEARPGDDMGRLWYDHACSSFMNDWFSGYEEAQVSLRASEGRCLFPYGAQFVVADTFFVETIGLDPGSPALLSIGRDLVAGYGRPGWHELALKRLQSMRPA